MHAGGGQVLGESEDVVAVGKPPTVPVHVSGQYRKNTVLAILQAERPDLGPLLPVHRLGARSLHTPLLPVHRLGALASHTPAARAPPGCAHRAGVLAQGSAQPAPPSQTRLHAAGGEGARHHAAGLVCGARA